MTSDSRKRIEIEGIVQGVGFRPFVYQLARRLGVDGWVRNDSRGVTIEAEAPLMTLENFLAALKGELPPLASISSLVAADLAPSGEEGFAILQSDDGLEKRAQIAPDTFVCPDCLRELFDPADRRYRYPFINCTNCGPRYTIVTATPYDRPNTTMVDFPMCPACRQEYGDPLSRRFHAQPNACPVCGPRLTLLDDEGSPLSGDPVAVSAEQLRLGRIVAVKGLGGYHLAVDAGNDEAVRQLRRRKLRDEKPFALMSCGLEEVRRYAEISEREARLLTGTERPIVLLQRRPASAGISSLVAPGNRYLGVMLPYTPLHYLLLDGFDALVMTSANLSDEPIAFEDEEARRQLGGIADFYLLHDRRIHMRCDDSIARVVAGRAQLLRRSRGYVPRPVFLPQAQPSVLALGGDLKNTVCLTQGDRAYLSQHVGDLKNLQAHAAFARSIDHLQTMLQQQPEVVAHDLHPDYHSSRFAESLPGVHRVAVQHHHAHLASCMAEHGLDRPVIGVIFDGIGYGADGHIWGGEFLLGDLGGFRRLGQLSYTRMPGGDAATREPWRMAVSYLHQAFGEDLPELPLWQTIAERERKLLLQMLAKGINSPWTSSCGRLFDGVAALVGIRGEVSFEGQAALELEMAIGDCREEGSYEFALRGEQGREVVDTRPIIRAIVNDLLQGEQTARISARFHNTLAAIVLCVCQCIGKEQGVAEVALSGGVFQNRYLTERILPLLEGGGFTVYTHSLVPTNDGGLALGQAAVAGRLATSG